MTDRPIIFSAPMVRALLDGRKFQTRRLLKPAPFIDQMGNFCAPDRKGVVWNWGQHLDGRPCTRNFIKAEIRYAPGDRLYVREANELHEEHGSLIRRYVADRRKVQWGTRAQAAWIEEYSRRHCPSIHMPRWASRLTLIVDDVRVERLQDISEADAIAEGIHRIHHGDGAYYYSAFREEPHPKNWIDPVDAFHELWDSLHTKPGERWSDNPWVVVISWPEVIHQNIDRVA